MGTLAIVIGIGIVISLGSVKTVLQIFIEANFIGIRIGVIIGIGVGQWKHTIRANGPLPLSDCNCKMKATSLSNWIVYQFQSEIANNTGNFKVETFTPHKVLSCVQE